MDGEKDSLKLLMYLDHDNPFRKLVKSMAKAMYLPESTVMMVGLGVFSSMACRRFHVSYQYGGELPIGLYVLAEQPPGASKSWCIKEFQRPFFDIYKATESIYGEKPVLFASNPTPEGLEDKLIHSKGFFSCVSSEQGVMNTLLGLTYGNGAKKNNNDVVLSGFDGGYVSIHRVTRKTAYTGEVCGSITVFAQEGTIDTILNASDGTGLGDRFLMLSEPHSLGSRNHSEAKQLDTGLLGQYAKLCGFFNACVNRPVGLGETQTLLFSDESYDRINEYRNELEQHLVDGGKYASSYLRGACGKADMQIMKLAANLFLLSGQYDKSNLLGNVIDYSHVVSAIYIFNHLLEHSMYNANQKYILGENAEYAAVVSYLEKRNGKVSIRAVVNSLRTTRPFKEMNNPCWVIRDCITRMVKHGSLAEHDGKISLI